VGLDHHIGRPANHHQVLGVVAPDQDELTPPIDICSLNYVKVWLAWKRGRGGDAPGAEPANQPRRRSDQPDNNQHADGKPHSSRHARAEQHVEHVSLLLIEVHHNGDGGFSPFRMRST